MDLINIATSKILFESIEDTQKPIWAGHILSLFDDYVAYVPKQLKELYAIIEDPTCWYKAHSQFTEVRRYLLANPNFKPENYLLLAELVAKITYNATGGPAQFDADSGWYIPQTAIKLAAHFKDIELENSVRNMIFSRFPFKQGTL